MVKAFGNFFIHGPGAAWKSITSSISKKSTGTASTMRTLRHWRTPTVRPPVPDPTDPDMLAQLNSTRWTSDLSQDPEARRTYKLLRAQGFAWIPHLFIIPGMTFVWTWFHPTGAFASLLW